MNRENKFVFGVNEDYMLPPVVSGYKHIVGNWQDGFVIKRDSDGSEFVWIPVGFLDCDGTLNGVYCSERFGRRYFCSAELISGYFTEQMTDVLIEQIDSVKKHGGFYISRFEISKDHKGNVKSVKYAKPCTGISFNNAMNLAESFEQRDDVKSHLTFGAEYDSVLKWFIKSSAKTRHEISVNSSNWGNFSGDNCIKSCKKTGSSEEFAVNRIYDFAGNLAEFTQEKYKFNDVVIRGGSYLQYGYISAAWRENIEKDEGVPDVGFRIALCIK